MTLEQEYYIKDRYLQILSSSANLTELCNFTASCIGNPVAVTLTTKTIIAKSSDYSEELVKEYTDSPYLCSEEELQELSDNLDKELKSRQPIVRVWPYLRHKRINCGCFWRCVMLAVIDCPITKKAVTDDMLKIIGISAPVFLSALRLNSYIDVNTVNPIETFLIGLLRGEIDQKHMHKYLYDPVIHSASSWCVMKCRPLKDVSYRNIKSVVDQICSVRSGVWCVDFSGNVIILSNGSCKEIAETLRESCASLCQIAVSAPFDNILTLPDHLDEVHTALELAEYAEDREPVIDTQKYRVLLHLLPLFQSDPSAIISPVISQIKLYDQEHDSAYYQTLKSFLFHKKDYNKVAEALHVHKNTVAYRIQKVCELFHLDLKDSNVISNLYLSLFADFRLQV
ncbi:MAG: helix-turn-helix domain-containing protein [Clostridiales bacterium]|nr:helix-turn-helix domain-containing protein [Clostridiales bacterium]